MKRKHQSSHTVLVLEKENFKFSAAHFLIFDELTAERLHGHNYRVRVEISTPAPEDLAERGYFIDFNLFKKSIKARLDLWDERVLLPKDHPEMNLIRKGPSLEVRFRDRFYCFPWNEVVLLPINNTSVEQLSMLLAQAFFREFKGWGVRGIQVTVEETQGQGARSRVQDEKSLIKVRKA